MLRAAEVGVEEVRSNLHLGQGGNLLALGLQRKLQVGNGGGVTEETFL